MRIGNRTYRDVEKMDLAQLKEVRTAILDRREAIVKLGMKLPKVISNAQRIMTMDGEMVQLNARLVTIDQLAKKLVKEEAKEMVKQPDQLEAAGLDTTAMDSSEMTIEKGNNDEQPEGTDPT